MSYGTHPNAWLANHLSAAPFDVRSAILDTVTELEPDIVAVGTRGLGSFERLVLGSTASALVHHAPCSVLVVRAEQNTAQIPAVEPA